MGERMARSGLEEKLESITREFVRQIVGALRNASFGDVAQLQVASAPARPRRVSASPASSASARARSGHNGRGGQSESRSQTESKSDSKRDGAPRQTADRRAELADRVLKALETSGQSLGVRALSSELGVAADLLATPLRELRAAGRIAKHGEKRATTYSLP